MSQWSDSNSGIEGMFEHCSEKEQSLLHLVALLGGSPESSLLEEIASEKFELFEAGYYKALSRLSDIAFLARDDDRDLVFFVHDRIQDCVLRSLGSEEMLEYHRFIGLWMFERREDFVERSDMILHLCHVADSLEVEMKEILAEICYDDTLTWIRQITFPHALKISNHGLEFLGGLETAMEVRPDLARDLVLCRAPLLLSQSRIEECKTEVKAALEKCDDDRISRARLMAVLLDCLYCQGTNPKECLQFGLDCLENEGLRGDPSRDYEAEMVRLSTELNRDDWPGWGRYIEDDYSLSLMKILDKLGCTTWMMEFQERFEVETLKLEMLFRQEALPRVFFPQFLNLLADYCQDTEAIGGQLAERMLDAGIVAQPFISDARFAYKADPRELLTTMRRAGDLALQRLEFAVAGLNIGRSNPIRLQSDFSSFYFGLPLESCRETLVECIELSLDVFRNRVTALANTGVFTYVSNLMGETESLDDFPNPWFDVSSFSTFEKCFYESVARPARAATFLIYGKGHVAIRETRELRRKGLWTRPATASPFTPLDRVMELYCRLLLDPEEWEHEDDVWTIADLFRKLKNMKGSMLFTPLYHFARFLRDRSGLSALEGTALVSKALLGASRSGALWHQALFWEHLAIFLIDHEEVQLARNALLSAEKTYAEWGCVRKAGMMREAYPTLLGDSLSRELGSISFSKMEEAIRTELSLRNLLGEFLGLVLKCSGADRGVLIVKDEHGDFLIEADQSLDSSPIFFDQEARLYADCSFVSSLAVDSVLANQIQWTVEDASSHPKLSTEPLATEFGVRSLIAVPISFSKEDHEKEVLGVVHLTNSLLSGVFSVEKRLLIQSFCTQIAVYLQNALSVRKLERYGSQFRSLFDSIPCCVRQDDMREVIFILTELGFFEMEDPRDLLEIAQPEEYGQILSRARIITLSAEYTRTFGHVEYGGGLLALLSKDRLHDIFQGLVHSLHPSTPFEYSFDTVTLEERPRYFFVRHFFNPETLLSLVSIFDITALREAQMAKDEQERIVGQLTVKHDFLWSGIGQITHEIRNPLLGLYGGIEIVDGLLGDLKQDLSATTESQLGLFDEMKETLSNMRHAAAFQKSVLNLTIDLAKLENGSLDVHPTEGVKFSQLLRSVIQILSPKAERNNSELKFSDRAAEIVARDLRIVMDEFRFEQVVVNLCSNACKFTVDGTVTLDVVISPFEEDESKFGLDVAVIDTGIGMSEEECSRLFKKFSQANESIQARFGGSGLGLFLAQNIARLLGGQITVSSEVGVGSTFTLRLPEVRMSAPADENCDDQQGGEDTEAEEQTRIVWFADDQKSNRTIISFYLRNTPYDLSVFVNGKELLEAYSETPEIERPEFILLDKQMPIMGGIECCEGLVALGTDAVIYCLSGKFTVQVEKRPRSFTNGNTRKRTLSLDKC